MKKMAAGALYFACVFMLTGWGSTYSQDKPDERKETGEEHADRTRQSNDEDIKRTQGDESGRRDIHTQGALQNDERGRW